VADESRHVDGGRRLLLALEQFLDRIVHPAVLSGHDRRDALAHDRRSIAHLEQAFVVVAVHVDETRRERQTVRIDDALARHRFQVADRDDSVTVDAHGAAHGRRACAVDDARIDDQRRRFGCRSLDRNTGDQRRDQRGAPNGSQDFHSNISLTLSKGSPRRPNVS